MEQYEGTDVDPAKWFYRPLSRANVLGLVRAAEAGLEDVPEEWANVAAGSIWLMNEWLNNVSTQRLDRE